MIRIDIGSQFIAKALAGILKFFGVALEFFKPIAPRQSAYIGPFHSFVTRLVSKRSIYHDLGADYF